MQAPMTLEAIRPLVANAEQQQTTLVCTFVCPVSGERVESRAQLQQGQGISDKIKRGAQESMMWQARSALARSIHRAFGYNFLSRMATDVATKAMHAAHNAQQGAPAFTQEARDAALIEAFRAVSSSFAWDPQQRRYVSAKLVQQNTPAFDRQLQEGRILVPYDQHMASRILIDIAAADGKLAAEEENMLRQMLPPQMPPIDQLRAKGPVTQAELEQISQGPPRHTALMLAWAMAAIDREVAPQEIARVNQIANWLGIDQARSQELRSWAFQHVLDQLLHVVYAHGQRDPQSYQEYIKTAQRLGMAQLDAERADAAWRKRHNIF
jgi:uncharacterized tellurite resistance protein B-like protein